MAKEQAPKKKERRPSALKRDLQAEKARLRNKMFRSKVKTAIRRYNDEMSNPESAKTHLNEVYSLMDKGVKKGVYTRNKASRTKSRLAVKLTPASA